MDTINPLRDEALDASPDLLGETALRVVTGAVDGGVRLWNTTRADRCLGLLGGDDIRHEGHVNAIEIDARSKRLFTADASGIIFIWKYHRGLDLKDYNLMRKIEHALFKNTPIVSLCLHPRRRRGQLLVQAHQSKLALLDLTTNTLVATYKGSHCEQSKLRASLSPDGLTVVAGSEDGRLYGWNAVTGQRLRLPPQVHDLQLATPLRDLAWHPLQHVIVLAAYGGQHPVLLYQADRPDAPVSILPFAEATQRQADRLAKFGIGDNKEKGQQRRRRIRELQERRKHLLNLGGDGNKENNTTQGSGSLSPGATGLL